jgi:superfamily I DNA/RNA helicase
VVSNESLAELAAYYDTDLNGSANEVFDLVPRVLERCKNVDKDKCIDFNDMIWLPVVLNLVMFRYDMLLVDEAQDLNRCQQALAMRAGKRLVLCGDPKQAIYGFAGADADSMPRMERILSETDRGCVVLPLTVTRRCAKNIVKEAQVLVPEFEAFETNPSGDIHHFPMEGDKSYTKHIQGGDMVLCRVNAPLVSQCFRFITAGRKANIQGRDIGQGLISTVEKMKAKDTAELATRLEGWLDVEVRKETSKKNPSDARIIALQDRYECLCCFMEDSQTVDDVISKINAIFTDEKSGEGIRLSSIHKAKGLEAKAVYFLEPKGATCPHPMARSAWQHEQEMNLRYVAITRAIETLVYVS